MGLVSTLAGSPDSVMAGAFSTDDLQHGLLIPPDKKLDQAWVNSLYARGEKESHNGEQVLNIGMPCGGIGAGQLSLRGDGTLVDWNIFNGVEDGWGEPSHTIYRELKFNSPVEQGFALVVSSKDSQKVVRPFSEKGFSDIRFNGEYPIATISYADTSLPVSVTMEVFSPFIPLNAKDSALPATTFHFKLRNNSSEHVQAGVIGWLENPVCRSVDASLPGQRVTSILESKGRRTVLHAARAGKSERQDAEPKIIVFEDFESRDFGDWQQTGEAFGNGPLEGTAPNQGGVTGFQGKRLVNSFAQGDQPTGHLQSKQFTIDLPFINLLVGGGGHQGETCINLIIDGKVQRTAVGEFTEQLSWKTWEVTDLKGRSAILEIIDQSTAGWGHILVDQIEFSDSPRVGEDNRFESARDFGTMALACDTPLAGSASESLPIPGVSSNSLVESASRTAEIQEKLLGLVRSEEFSLAPGEEKEVTFVIAWHFPNAKQGHFYTTRFSDALEVVDYFFDNRARLVGDTRLWRDVYYDSSLPFWLLDRLMSTVSTLATGTCQWWANGRFYAYEGVGCCPGTCTHVWNYAQTHARLFPELSRSIRELQDFNPHQNGGGFHVDTGLVGFRGNDAYAADGQCGTVLKAYREHQMSADSSFLNRFWPRIKAGLLYSIEQDANSDGLIENSQHNTYDINYEGANTFVGALYLAALRAGEEMAREIGDIPFAKQCRAIFESGTRLSQQHLWNGEYFVQEVNLDQYPRNQFGPGCLSDQMFGQGWAHQLNLGYLYPQEMVASALTSVWKYNWALDIGKYNEVHKPLRWFVTPGQSGLFTCTWPHSDYLSEGTLYKNEVWTGIEYQVAGHMIAEGMVTEGLAICRAIHDRYQPAIFNPYNEIECGDHYARAMASWGVLLALSGYSYHGPNGKLEFSPQISPENFKVAFTAAEGWGVFEQRREKGLQIGQISVRWGSLRLQELTLTVPGEFSQFSTEVSLNNEPVEVNMSLGGKAVALTFAQPVVVGRDETLEIRLENQG